MAERADEGGREEEEGCVWCAVVGWVPATGLVAAALTDVHVHVCARAYVSL